MQNFKLYSVNSGDFHQSARGNAVSLGFTIDILILVTSRDVPDVILLLLYQFLSTNILKENPDSLIVRLFNGQDCAVIQLLFQEESMDLYYDTLGINRSSSCIAYSFNLSRELRGQEQLDISVTDDPSA